MIYNSLKEVVEKDMLITNIEETVSIICKVIVFDNDGDKYHFNEYLGTIPKLHLKRILKFQKRYYLSKIYYQQS